VVIAIRTDNFMSLHMVKDAVEALSRRWWISSIRQRFGAVGMAAACSQGVRSWRARCLWQWQGIQIAPLLSCHVSRFVPNLA